MPRFRKLLLSRFALLLFALTSMILWTAFHNSRNEWQAGGWEALRWTGRKPSVLPSTEALMVSQTEAILDVIRKAPPLSPPTGLTVAPQAGYPERPLKNGQPWGPQPLRLRVQMTFPGSGPYPTAGLDIWINDPFHFLGEPLLTDAQGGLFLLPPGLGQKGGVPVYARSAHPPGFEKVFPGNSMFPLWAAGQEPLLRSVVLPGFGLYQASIGAFRTRGGQPFYIPVTEERWIRALMAEARSETESFMAGLQAGRESGVARQQIDVMRMQLNRLREIFDEKAILERHHQLIAHWEQLYPAMRAMNPAQAEQSYNEAMEMAQQQLEESLEAAAEQRVEIDSYDRRLAEAVLSMEDVFAGAEAAARAGNWDALEMLGREQDVDHLVYIADAGRAAQKLEGELSQMSLAQRNAPAWGFELPEWHSLGTHRHVVALPFEATRPSGLVSPGTPGARALVAINEAFFEKAEKEGGIHLLSVQWWEEADARYRSEGAMFYSRRRVTMLDELWPGIDWQSLFSLVE